MLYTIAYVILLLFALRRSFCRNWRWLLAQTEGRLLQACWRQATARGFDDTAELLARAHLSLQTPVPLDGVELVVGSLNAAKPRGRKRDSHRTKVPEQHDSIRSPFELMKLLASE
jgi:hypothetical protein